MPTYTAPHHTDPSPWLYPVVAGSVLREMQTETALLPGSLLLLLCIDTVRTETQLAPTTSQLCTGWQSISTVREKVRQLETAGYLTRVALKPRAARRLLLTAKGLDTVSQLKIGLREAARRLAPATRWPRRF